MEQDKDTVVTGPRQRPERSLATTKRKTKKDGDRAKRRKLKDTYWRQGGGKKQMNGFLRLGYTAKLKKLVQEKRSRAMAGEAAIWWHRQTKDL